MDDGPTSMKKLRGDKRDKNIKSFLETVGNIKKLPNAGCTWVDGVGHDPYHPAMQAATLQLADAFIRLDGSWPEQR